MHSVPQTVDPEYIHDDDAPWPAMAEATRSPRQVWRESVQQIAERARQTLPACTGRIDAAVRMVLHGDVELLPDGKARVGSQSNGELVYHLVNGSCTCRDFEHAPSQLCKHRLAAAIRRRAGLPPILEQGDEPEPPAAAVHEVQGIDPKWVQMIHGKPHVRYQGLLALAHERGLVSLKARFVGTPTLELAVAEAEAVFADGRIFCECGDATPANIQAAHIRPHLLRMALTRAKSRALRDALNVGEAAVEELE